MSSCLIILWELLRQGRRVSGQQTFPCCFHGCSIEMDKWFATFILLVCYWYIHYKILISFKYIHSCLHTCYFAKLHTSEHPPVIGMLSMVTKDRDHHGAHHCLCYPCWVLLRLQCRGIKNTSVRKFMLKRSQHLECSKWPQALFCGKVLTKIIASNPYQHVQSNNYQVGCWSPCSCDNMVYITSYGVPLSHYSPCHILVLFYSRIKQRRILHSIWIFVCGLYCPWCSGPVFLVYDSDKTAQLGQWLGNETNAPGRLAASVRDTLVWLLWLSTWYSCQPPLSKGKLNLSSLS